MDKKTASTGERTDLPDGHVCIVWPGTDKPSVHILMDTVKEACEHILNRIENNSTPGFIFDITVRILT